MASPYFDYTLAQCLTARTSLRAALDKTLSSASAGGKSYSVKNAQQIERQIALINQRLAELDPTTYRVAMDRTVASFA